MQQDQFHPEIFEFPLADLPAGTEGIFKNFATRSNAIFLDGCADLIGVSELNRYSFLACDPVECLTVSTIESFDFNSFRQLASQFSSSQMPGLPPFQGGIAGILGYEFNSAIENIRCAKINDFECPLAAFFVYDTIVAIDHRQGAGWIISQGWSKTGESNPDRANERLRQFKNLVFGPRLDPSDSTAQSQNIGSTIDPQSKMIRIDDEFELYSDFSRDEYLQMIAKAVDYIHAGDIFQVNLSQRLLTPAIQSSSDLYISMRNHNPAPFSGYLDFGDGQLISASPERLILRHGMDLETRPIKGTRRRTHYPEVDLNVQNELAVSEKDRAENIMIVDLMRNDLSKVAEPDSVLVSKLCGVEQYQNVLHLVSVVKARLADEYDAIDLLKSVFPGGSITGAPKIRSMEIISELEPTARGPYCGSLGYINFDGSMDFNILIRSVTAKRGWWQVPVGGGIVADSIPEKEYEETWTKAIGMLRAIRATQSPNASVRESAAIQQ